MKKSTLVQEYRKKGYLTLQIPLKTNLKIFFGLYTMHQTIKQYLNHFPKLELLLTLFEARNFSSILNQEKVKILISQGIYY